MPRLCECASHVEDYVADIDTGEFRRLGGRYASLSGSRMAISCMVVMAYIFIERFPRNIRKCHVNSHGLMYILSTGCCKWLTRISNTLKLCLDYRVKCSRDLYRKHLDTGLVKVEYGPNTSWGLLGFPQPTQRMTRYLAITKVKCIIGSILIY